MEEKSLQPPGYDREKILEIIQSLESKEHPEVFTPETLAHAKSEDIYSILNSVPVSKEKVTNVADNTHLIGDEDKNKRIR